MRSSPSGSVAPADSEITSFSASARFARSWSKDGAWFASVIVQSKTSVSATVVPCGVPKLTQLLDNAIRIDRFRATR